MPSAILLCRGNKMPTMWDRCSILRVSRDPAFCSVKRKRKTLVRWRDQLWIIVDREWDRFQKEWNYDLIPA